MMEVNPILEAFGPHLIFDGYGSDYTVLADLDRIYSFLEQLPDLIHMTKIMPPYAFKYSGKVPADWGLSGFVLIAESHISIHTFPDKGYFSVDIFSCKDFAVQIAIDFIQDRFPHVKRDYKILDRGLEFPRDTVAVKNFMLQEREAFG